VLNFEFRHSEFTILHSRRRGFSLVELLTVIFIITLLIGILVPSLSAARNAAKKMTTKKALDSIKVGLEMFKNDNGPDFPQTNGYPPSFAHPPISGALTADEASQGRFPFIESKPVITGAHWLPAMLMGVDQLGYIKRSIVPNKDDLQKLPWKWYTPDPLNEGKPLQPRGGPYADTNGLAVKKTKDLPGRPNRALFGTGWTSDDNDPQGVQNLPVVVDAFDQPILYYAANAHGRESNMVERKRKTDNNYDGGDQEKGPPMYFHQDNWPFTGGGDTDTEPGWDFGNTGAKHAITLSGAKDTAVDMVTAEKQELIEHRENFARYIIDRKIYSAYAAHPLDAKATMPLRAVNPDSYLLISAGVDGRYGTNDDVSNLPPWVE
jgi:prepilin-type N-terminal cleavage/methylation domain-containing protein